MGPHDKHVQKILDVIEANPVVSQRSLANDVGIALGLTNLLLRKIVRRGWIRLVRLRPNRVRYLITPAGLAAKGRIYRSQLAANLRFYMETKDRIHASLSAIAQNCPTPEASGARRRIVLYGAGEVAEIGFVCLQGTDFDLVGVVEESPRTSFLGLPVHSLTAVTGLHVAGAPFDRLVIMSLKDVEGIRAKLAARGVPDEAVHEI